jgi:hypothetical protein
MGCPSSRRPSASRTAPLVLIEARCTCSPILGRHLTFRPGIQYETQTPAPHRADHRRLAGALRASLRGRGHHRPGFPPQRSAPRPLPRPDQDPPAACADHAGPSTSSASTPGSPAPHWAAIGSSALPDSGPRPRLCEFASRVPPGKSGHHRKPSRAICATSQLRPTPSSAHIPLIDHPSSTDRA